MSRHRSRFLERARDLLNSIGPGWTVPISIVAFIAGGIGYGALSGPRDPEAAAIAYIERHTHIQFVADSSIDQPFQLVFSSGRTIDPIAYDLDDDRILPGKPRSPSKPSKEKQLCLAMWDPQPMPLQLFNIFSLPEGFELPKGITMGRVGAVFGAIGRVISGYELGQDLRVELDSSLVARAKRKLQSVETWQRLERRLVERMIARSAFSPQLELDVSLYWRPGVIPQFSDSDRLSLNCYAINNEQKKGSWFH